MVGQSVKYLAYQDNNHRKFAIELRIDYENRLCLNN